MTTIHKGKTQLAELVFILPCPTTASPIYLLIVSSFSESIPMKTLQCYNDYTSLTTCTCMECSEAYQFMNVTLNF
uniref:Cytokine receptor common subunit beta N-terminal domain-containing protein n=1 Tax=Athene cunicularia TaxID=194338 RepID=A0A663MIR9_ATHCN